jgi:hypothetical protein
VRRRRDGAIRAGAIRAGAIRASGRRGRAVRTAERGAKQAPFVRNRKSGRVVQAPVPFFAEVTPRRWRRRSEETHQPVNDRTPLRKTAHARFP